VLKQSATLIALAFTCLGICAPLDRVLMVSNDQAKIKAVHAAFRRGIDSGDLRKAVKALGLVERAWKSDGLILVDPALPVLAHIEENGELVKSITDSMNSEFVFSANKKDSDPLRKAVSKMFPANAWPKDFDVSTAGFGLDYTITATLAPADGSPPRSIEIHMPRDKTKSRNKALERFPMLNYPGTEMSQAEKDAAQARTFQDRSSAFICFGIAERYLEDGLREAADEIERLRRERQDAANLAYQSLLKKLGLDGLPKGIVKMTELESGLRDDIHRRFVDSYKALGFQSSAEATRFVDGSPTASFTVTLGLYRQFRGRNEAENKASVGMVYEFLIIKP